MSKSKKYQDWAKLKAAKLLGQPSIEDLVTKAMEEINIKTEVKVNDTWKYISCVRCMDTGVDF